jgi:hypothetical protein
MMMDGLNNEEIPENTSISNKFGNTSGSIDNL